MEAIYDRIKDALSFTSLSERRKEQLQKEEMIDQKLLDNGRQCHQCVHKYIFHMRKLNRTMSEKIYDAPFYDLPTVYKAHMDLVDKYQQPLVDCEPRDVCVMVDELNKELDIENAF